MPTELRQEQVSPSTDTRLWLTRARGARRKRVTCADEPCGTSIQKAVASAAALTRLPAVYKLAAGPTGGGERG